MIVIGLDPGYRESAMVMYDGKSIWQHAIVENETMLSWLKTASLPEHVLVIEEMQLFASNYGVGREIFDSVFWSGRFAQIFQPHRCERLLRSKVRGHLGCSKGGDSAVRAALIDRFGPYKEQAIGRKATPGPLFGLKSHEFSALAIAVTYWDLNFEVVKGRAVC